jgi:type IV pilus assembly protein PilO
MANLRINLDFSSVATQFQGLKGRHAGLWPVLPRTVLVVALFCAIVAAGWALYWRGLSEELEAGIAQEATLKTQYTEKLKQAVNLETLRTQKVQVAQFVSQIEKQLPSKAEMDALLSDINQAGVGRGASLMLFKPGQTVVRGYYAELPIAVRVVGNYHDLGSFASDLANLARIVTLGNIQIQPFDPKGKTLAMDATAKTFRYLDPDEIAQQQAAAKLKPTGVKK